MKLLLIRTLIVVSLTAMSAPVAAQAERPQAPALAHLLQMAAAQVEDDARAMADTVVDEDYQQVAFERPVTTNRSAPGEVRRRRTRSDLVLLLDVAESGSWVPFRDVFEVDGRPVRDRDERLGRVLSDISSDSLAHAVAISEESARFNLDGFGITVDRTVNTPMTALLFLRSANQHRSVFRLAGTQKVDGMDSTIVAFTEQVKPSLIASKYGASAKGQFWLDPATGRVMRSALDVDAAFADPGLFIRARLSVAFVYDARRGIMAPAAMDESYELNGARLIISGQARYSNFRQFAVATNERHR